MAPLRPIAAANNAEHPVTHETGRGAALLLGELFVYPRVPEQLKAVKQNGATLVVDAEAHPHANVLVCDSVLS